MEHTCTTVAAEDLHLPGPDFIDRVWLDSDRSPRVLRNLAALRDHGRLSGTGYVSILPVDQGIEHSGAASFAPNPRLVYEKLTTDHPIDLTRYQLINCYMGRSASSTPAAHPAGTPTSPRP